MYNASRTRYATQMDCMALVQYHFYIYFVTFDYFFFFFNHSVHCWMRFRSLEGLQRFFFCYIFSRSIFLHLCFSIKMNVSLALCTLFIVNSLGEYLLHFFLMSSLSSFCLKPLLWETRILNILIVGQCSIYFRTLWEFSW